MSLRGWIFLLCLCASADEQLSRHRTLGKAFYENPTTQAQAVEEFQAVLKLNPGSAVDRLNYGLALLRAGKQAEGMAEIAAVQKADPTIPHTWFNLGIENKKMGNSAVAIAQLEHMAQIVPGEPITEYNLGVLYKAEGRTADAVKKFELAANLDPNFAAPHFQLFNYYRQQGKAEEARKELAIFQELKRRHEEAGTGNEDVEWSIYSEIYEQVDPKLASAAGPLPPLMFAARTIPGKADAATSSLVVIDLDGSGSTDLLVVSSAGMATYRKGVTTVPQPAFAGLKDIIAAVPGDYDNDGLTDLCVLTAAGPVVFQGTKAGFKKAAIELPVRRFEGAVWLDYDHDYDLDLVLLGEKSALMRNQLPAGFEDRSADFPFVSARALAGTEIRVIPDTKAHDLVVTYADRPAVLYKDRLGGKYAAQTIDAVPAGAKRIVAADLNNDSAPDLMWGPGDGIAFNENTKFIAQRNDFKGRFALGDFGSRGLLDVAAGGHIWQNESQGKFAETKGSTGLPHDVAALAAADFNGSGRIDLAAVLNDGTLRLLVNETPLKNNWTRVQLNGVKNLKLAFGSEVEVKSGNFYQKQVYEGTPLVFGVRGVEEIDTVRITWPNGMIQNEMKQKPNAALKYQEAQRLSGSCPMIWTWNGERFESITDVLGVAPLGATAGDGRYFPVDHDEYVSIRGGSLKERDGKLEVRITEELSEVSYLDEVKLIALDHPAEIEVVSNDKWKSPPFPDFRLFGVGRKVYPIRAIDDGKEDAAGKLRAVDRRYPNAFARTFLGVAKMHSLDLDFGQAAQANRAVMVLNGWVDWADGSTFMAQAQATPEGLVPPKLQVKDARGEWVTVIEDMGMPAGKPKTIAVDLTGKFLSSSREVRIVTNFCIYWDEIYLSEDSSAPETRLTALSPMETDLRFRGFSPARIDARREQPEEFEYLTPAAVSNWNPTPGYYTRYGDVTPLLSSVDDKMVIMGAGDEVRISFDAGKLPPLPAGWRRDWLLKVDGWAKDRDANTAFSQTVEPLPFHGMTSYPYPANEQYPDGPEYEQYRKEYNTRPALRLLRQLTSTGTQTRRED